MTDKIYKLGINIGNKLVKIVGDGQAVIDTNDTGESRYDNQLYKKLVLFSIAKYVEELYEQELSDKVLLSLAMGMPDDEYISTAGQDFEVIKCLIGEHVFFINNLPIEFEVKNIELLPQEFGLLVLFEKMEGGISPDVRTLIIDYGGMTRLRTVYDGFQQREINQDTMGVNRLIRLLVDKMKTGVSTEEDLTSLFKKEIKNYGKRRFEEGGTTQDKHSII